MELSFTERFITQPFQSSIIDIEHHHLHRLKWSRFNSNQSQDYLKELESFDSEIKADTLEWRSITCLSLLFFESVSICVPTRSSLISSSVNTGEKTTPYILYQL